MSEEHSLITLYKGAIIGSALGDAIGELAFKYFPEEYLLPVIKREKVLKYTDDTSMTISLGEELIKNKDIYTEHLGSLFNKAYKKEPWRGYGNGPPAVFYLVDEKKYTYQDAAKHAYRGQGSFGNGAAMRVSPVGLYFFDDERIVEKARLSALATHANPLGIDGAVLMACAVREAVRSRGKTINAAEFINMLEVSCAETIFKEKTKKILELLNDATPSDEAARILGNNVKAHESVPFAVYCFLKNMDSFKDCLYDAIFSGGDKDTLGAMACSISGAYLGIGSIPSEWVSKLENVDYLEKLAIKLFEAHSDQ